MSPLLVIVGTNASGKSNLGIELAKKYNGEIISADSRQVFKKLDLGSGKVTQSEMQGIKHHLIDVCEPGEFFSMADFQKLTYIAIEDILSRGKLPMLVGGTGLYVNCVTEGYILSNIMPDLAYREKLETYSTQELYSMLKQEKPDIEIEPGARNRIMRLLEKIHDGDPLTPQKKPRYNTLTLGVSWQRDILATRIDERLAMRMQQGMLQEVQDLLDSNVSEVFLYKLGLEYRLISDYLLGRFDSEEAMLDRLSISIKQFAKRQMTWFRKNENINWLNMQENPFDEACMLIDIWRKENAISFGS